MAKEFIVAIELGSSKITGIAGRKNLDGSISVLAVAKQDSSDCIRKGVVYNVDKTVQCLTNIVNKLELSLKTKIAHVYVGVGGQSIRSFRNVIVKELPEETIVSQEMVNELMDSNRSMVYPDLEILDAVTQEYKVDQHLQLDPVGIQCRHLEGNFLNILWRNTFYRNLNKCFAQANIPIAEMCLAPLALADCVLTPDEKRSGCVLVDLGAETTTVSVYFKNILRHLAVIPLGSNNITKDIASLQIDDAVAEDMKLKYASAFTKDDDINPELMLEIDKDRSESSRTFIDIVEARLEEIILNVWAQVPNDYFDKPLGGIILTGGGSNMKNIEQAFTNFTHVGKIRIADFIDIPVDTTLPESEIHSGRMNTVFGLLAKGDMNCAGDEMTSDLFAPAQSGLAEGPNKRPVAVPRPSGTGYVPTEEEKKIAEEEARKRREAEEEEQRRKDEEAAAEEERRRKENSTFNKGVKGLKNFFHKIVTEDE
jgi:cell division protein FtsA